MGETVEANLNIELNVECPHCDHCFDLMDNEDLNEEGRIMMSACPNGNWYEEHKKFEEDLNCPECGQEIQIRGIAW